MTERGAPQARTGPGSEASPKRAGVVAVCSRKGGVGKTTTAVHFSVAAASRNGLRTLLVDLDPQSHVRSSLSSLIMDNGSGCLSSVLLARKGDILDAAQSTRQTGLDVVLADDGLESSQLMLSTRIGREFVLKGALSQAEKDYDLIVLDCPPNVDTLTLNALVAARWVLTPTDLSVLAMEGVVGIVEAVETIRDRLQLPLSMLGILVTRLDRRSPAINREMMAILNKRFSQMLVQPPIPHSTAVARACLEGKPVYSVAPGNAASEAYLAATEALLSRAQS